MADVHVRRINNYTSAIIIDGKEMQIVDRELRDREILDNLICEEIQREEDKKRDTLGTILYHAGIVLGLAAFLYILGIASHSDYCYEFKVADEWSFIDYVVRMVGGFIGMFISVGINKAGVAMRGYDYEYEINKDE